MADVTPSELSASWGRFLRSERKSDRTVVASERCPDGVHLAELVGVVELGDVETAVDVETRLVLG